MGERIIEPDSEIVKAFNAFAIDLYMKTAEGRKGNLVISPITLEIPLTLAAIGAGKGTQTQWEIMKALKYERKFTTAVLGKECKTTMQEIRKTKGIKVATRMYISKELKQIPSFKHISRKMFDYTPKSIDFTNRKLVAEKINQFALSSTQKKLGKIISKEELVENTKMVIANAIYFRRPWDEEFDKRESFKSPFFVDDRHTVYVDYMCSRTTMKYASIKDLGIRLLELPFKKSDLVMTFILPNNPNGLRDFEKKLNTVNIMETVKYLKPITVTAEIPVFRIESSVNMIEPLKKLGITRVFSPTAQFQEMFDGEHGAVLNNVVQKACIEINEEGEKMSTSTASIMRWTTTQQTDHFSCFHPFMFIVRCTRTNLIHFIGRVSFEKEDISYIPENVYRTTTEKAVQTECLYDENEASTDEEKGMLRMNLSDTSEENQNIQQNDVDEVDL
ncbi:serpin B3-like [Chironomus tepperi]|uniref:serpin B3-like n=1 Tax=Chironomus tepperi TaxID=113505 RepID=UPI00391EEB82